MPRKRVTALRRHAVPEVALRVFLKSGVDYFSGLVGIVDQAEDGEVLILDEEFLRRSWKERREEILAEYARTPGTRTRPWAWWHFDCGMDPPDHRAQDAWLREHGQFTPEERQKDEAKKLALNGHDTGD